MSVRMEDEFVSYLATETSNKKVIWRQIWHQGLQSPKLLQSSKEVLERLQLSSLQSSYKEIDFDKSFWTEAHTGRLFLLTESINGVEELTLLAEISNSPGLHIIDATPVELYGLRNIIAEVLHSTNQDLQDFMSSFFKSSQEESD